MTAADPYEEPRLVVERDGPARDVLLMLSGGLVAIVKDVYGFEFGSSRGSKDKTAALSRKP